MLSVLLYWFSGFASCIFEISVPWYHFYYDFDQPDCCKEPERIKQIILISVFWRRFALCFDLSFQVETLWHNWESVCGNSNPPAQSTTAAFSCLYGQLFWIIKARFSQNYAQNLFLENISLFYPWLVFLLEGRIENSCLILPFSPNSGWHCGAASQVLNNTLDQGQRHERVFLSNRI